MKTFYSKLIRKVAAFLILSFAATQSVFSVPVATASAFFGACSDSAIVTETMPVSCFRGNDGSASVTVYNAFIPLTWYLDTVLNAGTDSIISFAGLSAGNYTAYYTDAFGCSDSISFTIGSPAGPLSADSCTHQNVSCYGANNGALNAGTISNAVGPVIYLWQNSNGDTISVSSHVTSLPPGIYNLTISDNCGTATCSQTITQPAAMGMTACSHTNVSCFGGSDGTLSAGLITNSIGVISYSWKNSSNVLVGTTANISNLAAGTYFLTVTDSCGSLTCTRLITQPLALSMTSCTYTNVNCIGGNSGSVSAGVVSNAIGIVQYSWINSSNIVVGTTASVSSLPIGTYTLTVNDSCGSLTCSVTIIQSPSMTMTACSKTDVNCGGASTGSVSAGVVSNAIGTVQYSWINSSNIVVGTTAGVSNLPAGIYTLTVTDGCGPITCSVTINQSAGMTMTACSKTDVNCSGASTGSVVAGTLSNAVGTIQYRWVNSSNIVVGTTAGISNLPAGLYTLTVNDSCGSLTCSVTIIQSAALSISSCSHTNVSCYGGSSGSVTGGTVTNPSGTVLYSWKNSSNVVVGTTATVSNLPSGIYSLTISDNCGSTTCTETIAQPALPLSLSACSHTNETCIGGSTGSVTAGTVSNSIGAVSYSWKNSANINVGNTPSVSNLPIGTYTLTVTDSCSSVSCSQIITAPSIGITITSCSHSNVLCYGGSNGSVSVGTIANSSGTINYSWKNLNNVVVGTTPSVTNLPAGTYTLVVSDLCGSDSCTQLVVQPASPLSLIACSATNVTCHGANNGSVSAGTISGGSGTLIYSWRDGSNIVVGTTATVNNLGADVYTLTVTDACGSTGCMQSVVEPAALTMAACTYIDANCNGSSTGIAAAGGITGSVGNVNYTWKNSNNVTIGNSGILTNIPAGNYSLTVTDNCSSISCSVTIGQPSPISMTACTHIDADCFGSNSGSVASGLVSGVTGLVFYTWTDGNNNPVSYAPTVSSLPAGDYYLKVTTDCGILTCSETIFQFPELIAFGCSHTDACYGGSNGSVNAGFVTGGVGTINYTWLNDSAYIVATTPSANNLPPGNYYLTISDDCAVITCDETILETNTILSSFSISACDSYFLPWGGVADTSGDYDHQYSTTSGCDSIVTAHVYLNPNYNYNFSDSAYISYNLPWGSTVTTSGDYTFAYIASNGCDSIVTAHIVILLNTEIGETGIPQNDIYTLRGSSLILSNKIRNAVLYSIEGQRVPMYNLAEGIYLLRVIYHGHMLVIKIKI